MINIVAAAQLLRFPVKLKKCETGKTETIFTRDFQIYKKSYPQMLKVFTRTPTYVYDHHSYLKNNYIKITLKKAYLQF